ncbi:MAG TPA: hypothetical protein VKA68_12680, partial [bacterium]|nr:hypothetical protein [bacterium]
MEATAFIAKNRSLPPGEDYAYLRKKGLEYIEQLSHEIWTDYNVHDPGITTLEILCYALTDLGYRTSYPVEDILAGQTPTAHPDIPDFFTARDILTTNPVTISDFRKTMIDVAGIKNAWLEVVDAPEPQLHINCLDSELAFEPSEYTRPLNLQGLYNVILEFDTDIESGNLNQYTWTREVEVDEEAFEIHAIFPPWEVYCNTRIIPVSEHPGIDHLEMGDLIYNPDTDEYEASLIVELADTTSFTESIRVRSEGVRSEENRQQIRELVRSDLLPLYRQRIGEALRRASRVARRLHSMRNLCEDFFQFKGVQIEEIAVCTDLEVVPEADVEAVMAEVWYVLETFLAPDVNFYTIKDLLERGKTIDRIFESPRLNHGFIDDDELDQSDWKEARTIHVSDIIHVLMDIEEITAVKNIRLTNFFDREPQTEGEQWSLTVAEGRTPRFAMELSDIVFYKEFVPYFPDQDEVRQKLQQIRAIHRRGRLGVEKYDLPVPEGNPRDILSYASVQDDFPLTYGVGESGVSSPITEERKAQAKQLQGFLLFFDRLLADYLAQLAHLKDLFTIDPNIRRTYFQRPFIEIPDTYAIFHSTIEQLGDEGVPSEIIERLESLLGQESQPLEGFITAVEGVLEEEELNQYKPEILRYAKVEGIAAPHIPKVHTLLKDFVDQLDP